MMTVAAIMGGLLPIMWTSETGADVMNRIAAPMIGGMVSSTSHTLRSLAWRFYSERRKASRANGALAREEQKDTSIPL
jgi:Cu/Ag efflux pump CusA